MSADTPNPAQELLFTRASIQSISERCAARIMQQHIDPSEAWKRAIEEEAELIEHKLALMQDGALVWDWHGRQLQTLRESVDYIAQT